jgi:hypothetical protein
MSASIFGRIDKEEKERVDELWRTLHSDGRLVGEQIFGDKATLQAVEQSPKSFFEGFASNDAFILANSVFFSKLLVAICPNCSCNKNPDSLKPYLERGVILPLLVDPLAQYNKDLASLIMQYPYIGCKTFKFIKWVKVLESTKSRTLTCPHCFEIKRKKIMDDASRMLLRPDQKRILTQLLIDSFYYLSPPVEPENNVMNELADAANQKNLRGLLSLTGKAGVLDTLRCAQALQAIPAVAYDHLSTVAKATEEIGVSSSMRTAEQLEKKEWALQALNINYDPAMSIEEYLDIILPRKKKVMSLIDALVADRAEGKLLQEINAEIWKINEEMSSSKAIESLTFVTDFVSNNVGILSEMLAGGLLGYSIGNVAGCGLGGVLGAVAGKLVSTRKLVKVSRFPTKTVEWLKEKIESPEEKLLSLILSKDIKVIQIWNLKRKLRKI